MAYQATFTANFEQWDKAVQHAKDNLKGFEGTATGVQRQLQSMFSRFDGSRVIKEANLLTAAIDKIGGATKLTEAEQRRANATLQEAIDKYKALGTQAPAALQKLSGEMKDLVAQADKLKQKTEETGKQSGLLGDAFGRLGPAIAGAFAVGTVTAAVHSFVEAGSAINDLSAKTGIGTTALQEFKYAAEQNGNSLDQITGAITQMSKRLVEGDKSAVGALNQLGLSMADLRGMAPENAFRTIAAEIAKVPDPMQQSALAMELFGKSGAQILPTIKSDMSELAAEAHRLGLVMSEDTIKQADDLGDAWDRMTAAGKGLMVSVIGPFAPLMTTLANSLASAAAWAGKAGDAFTALGGPLAQIASIYQTKVKPAFEDPLKELPKLTGDAAEGVRRWTAAVQERGQLNTADVLAHEKEIIADLTTQYQAHKKATDDETRAAGELKKIHDQLFGLDAIAKAQQWVRALGDESEITKLSVAAKKDLNRVLDEALNAYRLLGREAPDAMQRIWLQTADLTQEITGGLNPALLETGQRFKDIAAMDPFGAMLDDMAKFNGQTKVGLPGGILDVGTIGFPTPPPIKVRLDFGNIAADLTRNIVSAFSGGGDVGKTIGATIGGSIFGSLGGTITKAMSGLGGLMPKLLGAFGSALGPLGSLLGGGISALFGKLFGPSKEARENKAASGQIAEIQAQLLKQYGSLAKIRELGDKIGVDLAGAWGDQSKAGLQHFTGLLDEFNAKLKEQEEKVAATQAAVEKYGLTWQDLNAEGRVAGLTTEVTSLLKEQELLTAAGYDQQAVLRAQADAWNDLLAGALETGTQIPDAMAPILEELEKMGLLTDENRRKLLGLSDPLPPLDWQAMQSAAEKYGITLEALGPRFNQARLGATADQLLKDFQLLTQSGGDVGGVLQGMSDEISDLVQQSIHFGTTIPESMRPLIEELIRSGQLLDENGEKITDISQIKFGEDAKSEAELMTQGFKDVVTAIGKLTNALLGIPDVAEGVAEEVQSVFDGVDITIPVELDVRDPGGITGGGIGNAGGSHAWRGGRVTRNGVRYLAGGGNVLVMRPIGTDTVPAMLSPGEFVVSAAAAANVGTDTLAAINRGQAPGAREESTVNLTVNATVNAIDSRDVRQWFAEDGVPQIIDLLANNTRGLRTKWERKVG